jgi:hypothetical protein
MQDTDHRSKCSSLVFLSQLAEQGEKLALDAKLPRETALHKGFDLLLV